MAYQDRVEYRTLPRLHEQGIVRGNEFLHPKLNFRFSVPDDYRIINRPSEIIIQGKQNTLIKFDADFQASGRSMSEYIQYEFLKGAPISSIQNFSSK